jgi:hypothetical protein
MTGPALRACESISLLLEERESVDRARRGAYFVCSRIDYREGEGERGRERGREGGRESV